MNILLVTIAAAALSALPTTLTSADFAINFGSASVDERGTVMMAVKVTNKTGKAVRAIVLDCQFVDENNAVVAEGPAPIGNLDIGQTKGTPLIGLNARAAKAVRCSVKKVEFQ
jgi:hypothetical protein